MRHQSVLIYRITPNSRAGRGDKSLGGAANRYQLGRGFNLGLGWSGEGVAGYRRLNDSSGNMTCGGAARMYQLGRVVFNP